MPLYGCRQPNGSISFVAAKNKAEAVVLLDESGSAEGCPIAVFKRFLVHFDLEDDGLVRFDGFAVFAATSH